MDSVPTERGNAPRVVKYQRLKDLWVQFRRNRSAVIGGTVTLIVVLLALAAPLLTQFDPIDDWDLGNSRLPPGSRPHVLGTDLLGRDVWSRIVHGARISLTVGLVVQSISIVIGIAVGLTAGFFGGWVDEVLVSITNVIYAFPRLLFAIAAMSVLGSGIYNVFVALGIVGWATVARLVRGEVLSIREREFVEAARASGARNSRLMLKYILPNCLGPVIVVGTLGVANAIMAEATLSFLGLGVQPPIPSWGSMLSRGREYIWSTPWLTIIPGIAILVTVLGLNLLGDGLRDIVDPRLKE